MSGIEIVGVVLGALPLAISAYQHRKTIKATTSTLGHFEAKYDNFVEDVEHIQLLLKLSLQRLLSPLVNSRFVSQDEVNEFIRDPHPDHGPNQAILDALKDQLDMCYERYLKLMTDMHEAIMTLLEELDFYEDSAQAYLNREQNINSATKASKAYLKSALSYRKAQVRFGLKTKNREGILAIIKAKQQQMNELAQFSDTSMTIGSGPPKVSTSRATQFLLSYAQHVSSIYRLVRERWDCLCIDRHCACVWLRHPAPRTFHFDLCVMPARDESELHQWNPQGLDIFWEAGRSPNHAAIPFTTPVPEQNQVPESIEIAIPVTVSNPIGVHQTSTIVLEPAQPATSQARDSIHEIDDLCSTITASTAPTSRLGILTDRIAPFETYLVQSQPDPRPSSRSITLSRALQRSHPQRLWRNRSARFQLALAIASAHLQLLDAPCTPLHWSVRDILFPHEDGNIEESANLEMPFVESDFKKTPAEVSRRSERAFTSLGIILMELLFGELIEDHPLWEQEGWSTRRPDAFFRLLVARQWLDDVHKEGGPLYFAAVQWCLTESPMKLQGDRWRKDLADRVIMPLERSCDWIRVDTV